MPSTTPSPGPRNAFDKAAIALSSLALISGIVWVGLAGCLAGGLAASGSESYYCYDGYSYASYYYYECHRLMVSAWVFGIPSLLLSIMATPFQFRAFQLYLYHKNPNAKTRPNLCIVHFPIGVFLVVGYVVCLLIQWPCMFVYSDSMYKSPATSAASGNECNSAPSSPTAIAYATAVLVESTETTTELPDGTKQTAREDVYPDGSAKITVTSVKNNPDGSRTTTIHEGNRVSLLADDDNKPPPEATVTY